MSGIGYSMSSSTSQEHSMRQEMSMEHIYGDEWGDIPMYSLHRIKHHIKKVPIEIPEALQRLLVLDLIAANEKYRRHAGNKWRCLTSNNLTDAIETWEGHLRRMRSTAIDPKSTKQLTAFAVISKQCSDSVKGWFVEHARDLHYDMRSKVPWSVIQRLEKDLIIWSQGQVNPFRQSIETMILEVAEGLGIHMKDAENAWEQMGGSI